MYTLEKIESIINSCITYDQIKSCLNIVKLVHEEHSLTVLEMVYDKAYSMRKEDLREHADKMKILREERYKLN